MTSPERPAIRLNTPGDVAASVPGLLGFTPAPDSVVVICATDGRLGLTARVDLPVDPQHHRRFAAMLADAVLRGQADVTAVLLVGWEVDPESVTGLYWMLAAEGLPIAGAVAVSEGQFLPIGPGHQGAEWAPLPDDRVSPELVVLGKVIHRSRDEIAALFTHDPTVDRGEPDLTGPEYGLAWRLADFEERDGLIFDLHAADAERIQQLFEVYAKIGRAFPDGDNRRDGALTLAAICAYLLGDGATANIALDLVPAGYRLAGLIRIALDNQMHPNELRQMIGSFATA